MASFIIEKPTSIPYTHSQVLQYLQQVSFPAPHTTNDSLSLSTTLQTLTTLMRLHLLAFPYENTDMHYTEAHEMHVTSEALFDRFVVNRLGGSYCWGQNTLLLGVLQSIGFRAYAAGARVSLNLTEPPDSDKPQGFSGLCHMILMVQVEDNEETYIVDVGFGGSGPLRPIPIPSSKESSTTVQGTTGTERHRLRMFSREGSLIHPTSLQHTEYLVEVGHTLSASVSTWRWKALFAFTPHEISNADIIMGNYVTSHQPGGLFTDNVICFRRFVLDSSPEGVEDNGDNQKGGVGRLTLQGNIVKRHVGANSEVITRLESEDQRVQVIRKTFGIVLPPKAADNMKGRQAGLFATVKRPDDFDMLGIS